MKRRQFLTAIAVLCAAPKLELRALPVSSADEFTRTVQESLRRMKRDMETACCCGWCSKYGLLYPEDFAERVSGNGCTTES